MQLGFKADIFDNSYARLPDRFYAKLPPTPVKSPELLKLNLPLAGELGLDPEKIQSADGVAVLAGNALPSGADPLAMAYAGHQFGSWNPQLGDGRAVLLGEILDTTGERRDFQLKGAGRTPFSRMGDGRAWLGPVIREFLVSEAMFKLGIPTTRALAVVTTGETIHREGLMPGAVLTRIARSHVRVGTFEYLASRRDEQGLELLADYVIDRHFPEVSANFGEDNSDPDASGFNRYATLLQQVLQRQAVLVSQWQWVGFIHGVMNTDNMSVAGDTIDYGPCAFLDTYDPGKVFSSIDQMGRYAFDKQPQMAQWNLAVLAQALLPLISKDQDKAVQIAQGIIDSFPGHYQREFTDGMRNKLGLEVSDEEDLALGSDLLSIMAENHADFTNTFRLLGSLGSVEPGASPGCAVATSEMKFLSQFDDETEAIGWLAAWRRRLQSEERDDTARMLALRNTNPAIIPRNHRIEESIAAAVEGNYEPFEMLHNALQTPFDDVEGHAHLTLPPKPEQEVTQTFCGT